MFFNWSNVCVLHEVFVNTFCCSINCLSNFIFNILVYITRLLLLGFLCLKYYLAPRYRMRCFAVLVNRRCTGCKNKWSSLSGKQRMFTKTSRNYNMSNICERDAPCWDQTLRACFYVECKTAIVLPVRGVELRMRIQKVALKIYLSVPKYLCI